MCQERAERGCLRAARRAAKIPLALLLSVVAAAGCRSASPHAGELYEFRSGAETRWISPENPTGAPRAGGMENRGAKGRAFESIRAGDSLVLASIDGSGVIQRMWITLSDRSPAMLRSLKLEMYWDGAATPAVSAPLGDFFGAGLGRMVPFENALFASPEGRSFDAYVPMPFRHSARIVLTNESGRDLKSVFYDIDYLALDAPPRDLLYFHAYWRRERPTALGKDFVILPEVKGRGRYLGANIGVITDSLYGDSWWGEGEAKVYMDGDVAHPTLAGTGTEDYIGTGFGQGTFTGRYQGALVADKRKREWTFYRYHLPDAVFFDRSCRVTLQQIGGAPKAAVLEMQARGAPLVPVSISPGGEEEFVKLLERTPVPALTDPALPSGWTNFYRQDDVSATVYFYLDHPSSDFPPLPPAPARAAGL
jgi:hypothetical protein